MCSAAEPNRRNFAKPYQDHGVTGEHGIRNSPDRVNEGFKFTTPRQFNCSTYIGHSLQHHVPRLLIWANDAGLKHLHRPG